MGALQIMLSMNTSFLWLISIQPDRLNAGMNTQEEVGIPLHTKLS